ncbi:HAMP domain-containing histidine kinase [bacterium]|nr:HAMP domain-containing histidine kinase [bacterium]
MQNTITPIAKDTFIAMFTHDLKTPINSGIFALEMLLKNSSDNLNDFQKELLTDLLNSSKYMKRLTENALCKFRADNGNLTLNKEKVSVKKLVKDCIEETKYILNEKNQKLKFYCSQKDISANVDVLELTRVINNLISNASKYSDKNSVIDVVLKKIDNKIYFQIQDYGCGIKMKELDNVFEKYVRLSNNQKSAGTGLGLYITKLIIEAHNGNINIESKPKKGTKITFSIPE